MRDVNRRLRIVVYECEDVRSVRLLKTVRNRIEDAKLTVKGRPRNRCARYCTAGRDIADWPRYSWNERGVRRPKVAAFNSVTLGL